ncbi:hypothetical protein [Acidianus sp. HS-5]|uniref:hypothetical protein n=1 Tax=Acidianus sp. HS-5 TaxID=2886040 RepID=UPI001F2B8C58|nr:hypothetical protein [Acidianus sp. HS-5]BDC18208.1 hypothetical protein HS5_10980 [Acidianus sp. HS-5]
MIFKKRKTEEKKPSERVQYLLMKFEDSIRSNDGARARFYYEEIIELIRKVCDEK